MRYIYTHIDIDMFPPAFSNCQSLSLGMAPPSPDEDRDEGIPVVSSPSCLRYAVAAREACLELPTEAV